MKVIFLPEYNVSLTRFRRQGMKPAERARISYDFFGRSESGLFAPIVDTLLTNGDHYMHLADLTSYIQAQERLGDLYAKPEEWAQKAILNIASSGKFSSHPTIHEYTTEIWKAELCPVP